MSPVRVTWARTLGRARGLYLTMLALGGFVAASAASFALGLDAAEGGGVALAPLWAAHVAPLLPLLAALLGMDTWSDERASGRLEMLLTAPVSERALLLGKFLGVWTLVALAPLAALAASVGALLYFAPAAADVPPLSFLPGLGALALQGALWSAVAVASSAFFSRGAAAAMLAAALTWALPRAAWAAALAWAPSGASALGVMPLDAQVLDMASGMLSTGVLLTYPILSAAALYAAELRLQGERLRSRRTVRRRPSAVLAAALALVCAVLAAALALRLDVRFELPTGPKPLSPRTRTILAEAAGEVVVTCLLPRGDARFDETVRFLRRMRQAAGELGGLRLTLRFIDPDWDFGATERLVRRGAQPPCLFLERARRTVRLPLAEGRDERCFASALRTLATSTQRRCVYWTRGHGEASFDDYGPFGASDVARELARDGYRNLPLDLDGDAGVPRDSALVVVAGAHEDFSRAESARLDAYLKQGGRLLALLASAESGGVAALLPAWGIRVESTSPAPTRTASGTDVLVTTFSSHPIVAPLTGTHLVLDRPLALVPSAAAAGVGASADGVAFAPLASVGGRCIAAVVERGAGTGADLAYRPTRLVAVGTAAFAMNGMLAVRANANRDFLLNCAAYLAGDEAAVAAGGGEAVLVTGLDRRERLRYLFVSAGVAPLALTLLLSLVVYIRRCRR